jgi:glycosyltransferase involved in cell wall biosynthesis
MSTKLSAIIIAKNEEKRIAKCLENVAFADERIVVDNGSIDKTIDIARSKGAKIFGAKEKDFSSVRELGLREASGKWVLYIDADEEVGEALQTEIRSVIGSSSTVTTYLVKRDTYYLGYHWPYQDVVERLFLKSALKGWHGKLHETPVFTGQTAILTQPLIHRTHRTLEEMLAKTNDWSVIEARLRYEGDHPPVVWWRLLRVMITGFCRSFFAQGGWKAGTLGWIESIYQAFSMFITYAKLWEMQQISSKSEVVNKKAIA